MICPETRKRGSVSECNRHRRCSLGMAGLPLTALAICLFIPAGESQFTIHVEHSQINVTVGENALISMRPSVEVSGGNWVFDGKAVAQWTGDSVFYVSGYQSRAEVFTTNGSLLLRSVNNSDSGEYRVTMFLKSGSSASATVTLWAIEPVSNVTVTRNNLSPVEINDTVVLICDAQGTIQRRTWLKDNQPIQENDRIFTTSDKANLTITRVKRTDTGTFNCTVSNDYNSGSTAIYVQVNYGPDNVRIVPQGPFVADIGLPLTLTCSAQSVPSGEYKWYNATNHLQTGQQYTIQTVSSVDSGNYTCEVYNNVTMKRSNLTVEVTAREKTATAPRGLSGGAIAGIVIGSVAGVCLVAAAVAWFVKTQGSRLKAGSDKGYPKMTSPSNIQPSQTEYAAVERKQPNQPKPEPSSNGANQAPPQAKDRDIIYTNPKIINAAAKPTSEVEVDKTDYATLKYQ